MTTTLDSGPHRRQNLFPILNAIPQHIGDNPGLLLPRYRPPNTRAPPASQGVRFRKQAETEGETMTNIDNALDAAVASNTDEAVLGLDIGGTSIKMGVVTRSGKVLATAKVPTGELDNAEAFERVSASAIALVREAGKDPETLGAIGVDVPGVVLEDGTLAMAPNIVLDLAGLTAALKAAFPIARTRALNDANAAALGEAWLGAGDGVRSAVMLTLGTGVGAGVIVDGKVVVGAHGAGGEAGHINVNPNEPEACGCGCHGCLEQYASARGLIRLYREECAASGADEVPIAHATDALAVFEAARANNPEATRACERLADYLARAMSIIAAIVDPEMFILGGGMCGGWDTFGDTCLEKYRAYAIPGCRDTAIRVATLGNDAGFLGAARQAIALL